MTNQFAEHAKINSQSKAKAPAWGGTSNSVGKRFGHIKVNHNLVLVPEEVIEVTPAPVAVVKHLKAFGSPLKKTVEVVAKPETAQNVIPQTVVAKASATGPKTGFGKVTPTAPCKASDIVCKANSKTYIPDPDDFIPF